MKITTGFMIDNFVATTLMFSESVFCYNAQTAMFSRKALPIFVYFLRPIPSSFSSLHAIQQATTDRLVLAKSITFMVINTFAVILIQILLNAFFLTQSSLCMSFIQLKENVFTFSMEVGCRSYTWSEQILFSFPV